MESILHWKIHIYLILFIAFALTPSADAASELEATKGRSSSSLTASTGSSDSSRTLTTDSDRRLAPKPASKTMHVTKIEGGIRNTYAVKDNMSTLCSFTKIEGGVVNMYMVKDGKITLYCSTDSRGEVTFFS